MLEVLWLLTPRLPFKRNAPKSVGILCIPSTRHGCTALTCLVTTFVSAKRHCHVTQAGRQQIGVKHWSTSTESDMEAFGSRPSDVKVAAFASEGYCVDELSERCVSLELTSTTVADLKSTIRLR